MMEGVRFGKDGTRHHSFPPTLVTQTPRPPPPKVSPSLGKSLFLPGACVAEVDEMHAKTNGIIQLPHLEDADAVGDIKKGEVVWVVLSQQPWKIVAVIKGDTKDVNGVSCPAFVKIGARCALRRPRWRALRAAGRC